MHCAPPRLTWIATSAMDARLDVVEHSSFNAYTQLLSGGRVDKTMHSI